MPLFRGSSRFESLILSHHSRFTSECNKEEINDDDDACCRGSCSDRAPTNMPSSAASSSILEQLLRRNVRRFRGGLVFEAHRLLYHSTLGWRVIKKKKKKKKLLGSRANESALFRGLRVSTPKHGLGFRDVGCMDHTHNTLKPAPQTLTPPPRRICPLPRALGLTPPLPSKTERGTT